MANYTIELYNILEKPFAGGTVNDLLTQELAIVPDLDKMDGTTQTFYDTFLRRNWDKEIGTEVVENWCWDVRHVMDDVAATLLPKLKLQLDNFETLMSRIIEEEDESTNTEYYNPMNKTTTDLKVQNVSERKSKNQRVAGLFKSNPEVMAAMSDVRMIYGEILEFLDRLFVGVI